MADTKENILQTALQLFARDGYEAVSVSVIAGALGITKGALYKHYENKRAIFNSIVERMYQIDAERSEQYHMPQEIYAVNPQDYATASFEAVRQFTAAQLTFWTEDVFASAFRRMLQLEQYRDREMAELYHACLTSGPVHYMEDIFRVMMSRGVLKQADSELLAVEFCAPLHLLIAISDDAANQIDTADMLQRHMAQFIQRYAVDL